MNELVYRSDCDLFAPYLYPEGIVRDLMAEYDLIDGIVLDEDAIYNFAMELLKRAQNVIDTAPTIALSNEL